MTSRSSSTSASASPSETPAGPPGSGRIRRILRRSAAAAGIAAAAGLGLAGLALIGLIAVANSEAGRERLAGWAGAALSAATGFAVVIDGLGPGLPADLRLAGLTLADRDGVWLRIDDARLAWRPAALLRGRLAIGVIEAAAVDLARLPAGAPAAETTGQPLDLSIPEPPLDLRLDRLALPDVSLGQPVLGVPARFALDGRLGARVGDAVTTRLSLTRSDGATGGIELDARLEPATGRLALDVRLTEAADGLVVRLLGLAPYPPLAASLAGDGPLADWRGRLAVAAPALLDAEATLGLRRLDDGHRLAARGAARWQGPVPPVIAPALAEGLRFALAAVARDDGALDLESLSLAGRDVDLAATGRLATDGAGFALQATAAAGPQAFAADRLAGWRAARLTAEATASGRLDRLDAVTAAIAGTAAEVAGDVAGGPLAAAGVDWRGTMEPAASGRSLRLSVAGRDVVMADGALAAVVGPAPTLDLAADLDAAATRFAIDTLTLTTAAAVARGGGVLALGDGDSDLALAAEVADLARLAPLLGPGWAGAARLDARLAGPITAGQGRGRLELRTTGLAGPDPVLQAALGPRPTLAADLALDPQAGLVLADLRLTGEALAASGGGRVDPAFAAIDARVDVRVPDIAPLARAAGTTGDGPVDVALTLAGPLADPAATLRVVADGSRLAGRRLASGRLGIDAGGLATRPAGTVTAAVTTDDGPVEASLGFRLDPGGVLRLDDLAASLFGLQVTGALDVALAPVGLDGRLALALPTGAAGVAPAGVAIAGYRLAGEGAGTLSFRPVAGRQQADLRFTGRSLRLGDARGGETLRLVALTVDASVADALATPRLDARLAADGLVAGGEGPLALRLAAAGPVAELAWQVGLDGPAERLDRLALAGRLRPTADPPSLVVERLDGRAGGTALALARPLTIAAGDGRLAVAGLDLAVGDGRIAGDADLSPGRTRVGLSVDRLPLAMIHAWVPAVPQAGTVAARADLATAGDRVTGEIGMQAAEVRLVAGPVPPPALAAALTATLTGSGTSVRARLAEAAGGERLAATLDLAVPVRLVPGSLAPDLDRAGPLAGEAEIGGDAAFLAETLALPDQRLAGTIAGRVRIAGSLARPQATGRIGLADGLYENFVTGTLVQAIDAAVVLDAAEGATLQLAGRTPGDGRVAVDGSGRLQADGAPAIEARLALADARLVARDDLIATATGDLAYQGGLDRGRLAGRLAVTPVEVSLKDRLPPSIAVLPVIEINRPGGDAAAVPQAAGTGPVIDLAIALAMPRRVFVRGRGLSSEWSGDLDVRGTSAEPRLTGEIGLVRGTFTFASKRFQLERGRVAFLGGRSIDPLLDLAAAYRTRDLTAVIQLQGPASDPALAVTSQPPLPESEVLAQVMFGKATARLSPLEAVQLAAALDSLASGDTWTDDTIGSIRQFLGLDVLTVDTGGGEDEKGPALEVGRYLGDRVYVGARRGLTDDTSGGRVEVEILPGLSLQSDILQDVEGTTGSVGLRWKHDY